MFEDDLDKMIAMSEVARLRPNWGGLADYLSLRGRGLRKPALVTLGTFVIEAATWSFDDRLELTLWVLEDLKLENNPDPLSGRILKPTIQEWSVRDAETPKAHFWLGNLGFRPVEMHYRRALELDPDYEDARGSLCNCLLGDVWFNQHHLPDYYIKSPTMDLLDIAEAEALWVGRENTPMAAFWLKEIASYRSLAEAWLHDHPPES